MVASRRFRVRALLVGVLLGVLLFALGLWIAMQTAPSPELRDLFDEALDLPRDAYEVERVRIGGGLRVGLRDVALLDERGDTVLAAPAVRFRYRPRPAEEGIALVLDDVVLERPRVLLEERPDGEWNFAQAVRMEAAGAPVDAPAGQIVLRNVRIEEGHLVVAMRPAETPARLAAFGEPAVFRGRAVRRQTVTGVNAVLPEVRLGGAPGWQVELGRFSARLPEQDIVIRQLAGVFGGTADGGVRFGLRELRTDRSLVTGAGDMRLTDAGPAFSLTLSAAPLDFADLSWMLPDVPPGTARFDAVIEAAPGAPTRLAFTNLEAVADGSRVAGRTTIVIQPGTVEPVFRDTDLVLDPLRLELLERLGLAEELPLLGEIRGSIATAAPGTVEAAALRIDLDAEVYPRGDPGAASRVGAVGALQILADAPWVRLDGVRLDFAPLDLRTVRALLDDPPDILRGVIRGGVQARGTLNDVRLVDGDLTYVVGDAPPTRLSGLSGRIRMADGTVAYDLDATAAPLALATLTELIPALPLQPTALSGPVSISGVGERMSIVTDLRGDAGGFDLRADLVLSDPFRFDVTANVRAFQPQVILARDLPVGVPLTGRIALRGTAADFGFDVDLRQPEGRVVLSGRYQPGVDPDRIEVAGRVENFRIGALFGRPGLFPAPMSGPIRITAAGDLLYRVDVDLVGDGSRLRLDGWWRATAIPSYAFQGEVLGLDLARLPWIDGLPRSRIAASFAIDARGTTAQTFAGRFDIDADGSVIEGDRVRQARLRGAVADGILQLDEGMLVHRDVRLEATGMLGLTRPAPDPLRFDLRARDLSTLAAILPLPDVDETEMSGDLALSGRIGGTLAAPEVDADLVGRRIRYRGFRARELDAQVVLSRMPTGWRGGIAMVARDAVLAGMPGEERFPAIRLDAEIREDQVTFAAYAERRDDVDISVSATAQIDDMLLQGIALESMLLRFGDVRWQLVEPAAIRWAGVDGVVVDGLRLRRLGEVPGEIAIDGRIPDTGEADFQIRLVNLSLADARALYPALPEVEGTLNLEAYVRGPVTAPRADITAAVTDLRVGDEARADRIAFEGVLAEGRLRGTAVAELDQMQVLAAELELPMELDLGGLAPSISVPEEGVMAAEAVLANVPIDLVAEMFPGISEGAGYLSGEVTVGGVVARPVVDGWITVEQGALRIDALGLRYTEMEGRIALDDRRLEFERFVARSGGILELDGVVIIEELDRPIFGLTARLDGFRAFDLPDLGRVAASGRLTLTGQSPAPVVRGQVIVEEARIEIPPLAEPALVRIEHVDIGQIGPDTIPGAVREPIPLVFRDLRIDGVEVGVGHDVWLTSDDARIQLDGEVVVFRERDDLRLFGELEAVRGTYTLRIGPITRLFDIERGHIQFAGTPDINPTLDLSAVHEVRNLTAPGMGSTLRIIVELTGTARFPELALTSDSRPPLPETELFSFLIFGRPSHQLGTVVGGQLAQDILLQEVLGGLVATQVEDFLMRDLGLPLDYVRVHTRPTRITDPFGQTVIEAGVQIGRDLFFTTEVGFGGLFAGAAPTWGAGLEWEIDPYWTWRVAYEPLARDRGRIGVLPLDVSHQFTTDIRRRWEFGHPDREVDVGPIEPADDLSPDPRAPIGEPVPDPEPPPRVPPTPPGAGDEGVIRED